MCEEGRIIIVVMAGGKKRVGAVKNSKKSSNLSGRGNGEENVQRSERSLVLHETNRVSPEETRGRKRKISKVDAEIECLEPQKNLKKGKQGGSQSTSKNQVRSPRVQRGVNAEVEFDEDGNVVTMEAEGIHTDFMNETLSESDEEGEIEQNECTTNNNAMVERRRSRLSPMTTKSRDDTQHNNKGRSRSKSRELMRGQTGSQSDQSDEDQEVYD